MDFTKVKEFILGLWDSIISAGLLSDTVIFISRLLLPVLGIIILYRCAGSLFGYRREKEVWGYLALPNGAKIELNHWENIVGRAMSSDVCMEYPSVSRTHGAIIREPDGNWRIYNLGGKMGITVRGKKLNTVTTIRNGDIINFGGVDTVFMKDTEHDILEDNSERKSPVGTLVLLTLFMSILCSDLCLSMAESGTIIFAFSSLALLMWGSYLITRVLDREAFELETIVFFLCAIGFSVVASSRPQALYKEIICMVAGVAVYWILGWFLRELKRAKACRWYIAGFGVVLLILNLFMSESIFGAKNWLSIGSFSFQPSEFIKICFVFAGAATLDRMFAKRNLILFVLYAGLCVGGLAIMSDFGTALVFFAAYLVIAFMRSGSFAAVILSAGGAVLAAFLAVLAKPYIAQRFATWGNAWADPNGTGYQQTRAMAACASGGLLGLGAGRGWLKRIFAADTDMVFAFVCEELGLIIAVLAVVAIVIIALTAIGSASESRSTFYVIAACASGTILLVQVMLNVFGSLDMLPFTGVTFPFVSNGGSSLIACWGLVSFIKACDTRPSASFAVKSGFKVKKKRSRNEEN